MQRWKGRLVWLALVLALISSLALEAEGSHKAYMPFVSGRTAPTQEPAPDLTITGQVYDSAVGPASGLVGALVCLSSCVSGRRQCVEAGGLGSYTLTMPGSYVEPCAELTLEATAEGYATYSASFTVSELRQQPERDIALHMEPTVPAVAP